MQSRDRRSLKQRLGSLSSAGVEQIPRLAVRPRGQDEHEVRPEASTVVHGHAGPSADRTRDLVIVAEQVAGCTRCGELATSRIQTVFGAGRPDARICFFGEAPGADEDVQGEPFVGRAGQLLTRIIEACRLRRDDVYILNVLKCRPPGNRTPLPDEVENCRAFFQRQFEIIAPEYICCLGTTAAQSLLQTTEPIGRLRKRWFTYRSAQVMCTYHPSYLLRNPAAKREVWDDMKSLMARLGIEP